MLTLKSLKATATAFTPLIFWSNPVRLRSALLVGALLLFFCVKLTGTTYYVDAQNGDDGYNGLAPAHQSGLEGPWRTISKVNQASFSPGDSILFKRGSVWVDGPLEPQNGGAPGGTITIFETVVGEPLIFDLVDPNNNNCIYFGAYGTSPDKPKIDCQGGRGIILAHNYTIVENLHVDNGGNNVLWLNRSTGINWIIIKNVDVTHSTSNAVRFTQGGANIWVKGLYVYDYGVNGILLNGSTDNLLKHVLVEDCWVENPVTLDLEDAITCHRYDNIDDLEGYIIIRNNIIRKAGEDGIDVTSGTHILLDGNDIRDSQSAGILLSKAWVNTVEVRNNFLYSNSTDKGNGDLSIRVPNVWAYNNVIAGDGHNCLALSDTDNTKIWNNVIAPANRTGNFIRFTENVGTVDLNNNIFDFSQVDQEFYFNSPGAVILFDYNCYFGTSSGQDIYQNLSFQEYRNADPLFEPHGFWGDPEFVSPNRSAPGFFQLAATSPCLNAGLSVPVPADFWGTPRPQGPQIDMGIFELATADCDPDPNSVAYPGSPCDDSNPLTINDVYDTDCNCAGVPSPCVNIGDADGDGVCADVDCDDNDANIAYQPGDACDDGDPNSANDIIQNNCNCVGDYSAPISLCFQVNSGSDDAEERASGGVTLTSSDLELAEDPNHIGGQTIGMRFNNLTIPQGATILNAYLRFTVDETNNLNPCELTIRGQASDNASTFLQQSYNISNRPRTLTFVNWSPQNWEIIGSVHQSPDLSLILQEIVDRNGYSLGHSIAIIIEGIGRRTAESFNGSSSQAAELCIEYQNTALVYDCPGLNANIGDPCDDGDNITINDIVDNDCNCAGTFNNCAGFGDADSDGVCANVDCNDNDPTITAQFGEACDDGDHTTINDIIDNDCNCAGTPTACTGIGDADNDGVCANMDCDDNDPNITAQVGDACDDGDPNTSGEFIQTDCSCGGGVINTAPITSCSRINAANDDAEERSSTQVNVNSSDLELISDGSQGDQVVGMRFRNLNIPQGANITNAFIQFTVDESNNANPCNLSIFGQDSDDAAIFNSSNGNISSRQKTAASASWSPPAWQAVGEAAAAQRTPDLSPIVQEIVNRSGYSANSAIVIIVEGSGRRVAESFDGVQDRAPELCVEYYLGPPNYDCPLLTANIGDACDDGDNTTTNDIIDNDCNCTGTPTACTGIGDADGDGICANVDCDDNNPNVTYQPGDACNDGDNTTTNDIIGNDCNCTGTPTACTGIGDADNDGICTNVDCDDNNPGVTFQPGDACNDGDNTTTNDIIDNDCNCAGTPNLCTGIGDADNDGICANVDCDDNNPGVTFQPGDACNDGDNTTTNDIIDNDCNCAGTPTACTGIGDADNDGVCANVDCDDNNPTIAFQPGDTCNDGDNTTINDTIDNDCNCAGTPTACTGIGDADNDGICANVDCDDNNPGITHQPGDTCDDGNSNTTGEFIQTDCSCGGGVVNTASITSCSSVNAANDDAEESSSGQMNLNSSDLELIHDRNRGDQVVGMRFNNLNIPQGATITHAFIQFTVDESNNTNPCNLSIFGQDSDDAAAFNNSNGNISSRQRTAASAAWSPPVWQVVGEANAAQRTPDLSPIVQEIVNRAGYSANSAMVIIIEGNGRRVAESFNGVSEKAPELCIEYHLGTPNYDCPSLAANIGEACDDGDNTTINDIIDNDCNCAGTPSACTGIGDNDGDGICANVDCDDNNPGVTFQPGDACNDGDPNTTGETIQSDCTCGGGTGSTIVTSCIQVDSNKDDAEELNAGQMNLTSSDLELTEDPSQGNQTVGMRFNGLGIPQGATINSAYLQFTVDEIRNADPCNLSIYGQDSDNAPAFTNNNYDLTNRLRTTAHVSWAPPNWQTMGVATAAQQTPDLSSIIQEVVGRPGYTANSSIVIMVEGTGRRTAESYDGSPGGAPELCIEYSMISMLPSIRGGEPNTITTWANKEEVLLSTISPIHVFPNPANDRLTLLFNSKFDGPVWIRARSIHGQLMLAEERAIIQGDNKINLEGLSLPSGLYFLQLSSAAGDFGQVARFVIARE